MGIRKHMNTNHSPQSSLVHECQNLTNPPPHGQNWCNKKQQIPHPLGHKKVPKPLVTPSMPHTSPGWEGGEGFNWQVHYSSVVWRAWKQRGLVTNVEHEKSEVLPCSRTQMFYTWPWHNDFLGLRNMQAFEQCGSYLLSSFSDNPSISLIILFWDKANTRTKKKATRV